MSVLLPSSTRIESISHDFAYHERSQSELLRPSRIDAFSRMARAAFQSEPTPPFHARPFSVSEGAFRSRSLSHYQGDSVSSPFPQAHARVRTVAHSLAHLPLALARRVSGIEPYVVRSRRSIHAPARGSRERTCPRLTLRLLARPCSRRVPTRPHAAASGFDHACACAHLSEAACARVGAMPGSGYVWLACAVQALALVALPIGVWTRTSGDRTSRARIGSLA